MRQIKKVLRFTSFEHSKIIKKTFYFYTLHLLAQNLFSQSYYKDFSVLCSHNFFNDVTFKLPLKKTLRLSLKKRFSLTGLGLSRIRGYLRNPKIRKNRFRRRARIIYRSIYVSWGSPPRVMLMVRRREKAETLRSMSSVSLEITM